MLNNKPYEVGHQNLKMFLERLNSRAEEPGWTEITKIKNKDCLPNTVQSLSEIAKKRRTITWHEIQTIN